MSNNGINKDEKKLRRIVTPLGAFALAFGCAVGWGAFVMPGTTFLPIAGPIGAVIGVAVGALIMIVIGVNYHYMIGIHPDAGGTYTYTKVNFGYDHGFLNGWFLILTYVAIIWANATAIPLIARNLLGSTFQFGFHYEIAGFHVYFGEVMLAEAALILAAMFCFRGKIAITIQIIMALVLCAGIVAGIAAGAVSPAVNSDLTAVPFAPDKAPVFGVISIIALAPWAFAGFESISHSAEEFSFPVKKTLKILIIAVIVSAVAYSALTLMAALVLPEGCSSWTEYIGNLGNYSGVAGLPTFFFAESTMGSIGRIVLALTTIGAIVTGLLGNYIASSRLLFAMSKDDMMPKMFSKLDNHCVPKNAVVFLMLISLVLPFFGRTAVSWIVDVTTVGATITYAYASASTLKTARQENNRKMVVFGMIGLIISLLFVLYFLIPNLLSVTTLSTESYLILAAWAIIGLLYFMFLFKGDDARRLGHTTLTWIVLLALIIFTSTVWVRQETDKDVQKGVDIVNSYETSEEIDEEHSASLRGILNKSGEDLNRNSMVQIILIIVALVILFYTYSLMQKRERQMEVEKVLAEESSRAKTSFLSNMSHEIRTPMNAIIGLDNIALKDPDLKPQTREQLEKIGASAKHLLGLINDILDMSRIESGRMVLKNEEFSFRDLLDQINIIINGQCVDKGLNYECHIIGNVNDFYIGDDMKLKQVIINILGNAVKFTEVPGSVTFTVEQIAQFEDYCTLRFIMKDTGVGMSKEYIPRIFDAFSQESSNTNNKYGSTGLGMAITKNIVEMMNGDIKVESEKGVGTTFFVKVTLKKSERSIRHEHSNILPEGKRVLVVDDDEVACEHVRLVAESLGMKASHCTDVKAALDLIESALEQKDPYQFVITDYKMPYMDGITFTKAVHDLDHGLSSVIIMTGYSYDDMRDEAFSAGVSGIISKPVFADTLLQQIKRILFEKDEALGLPDEASGAESAGAVNLEGLHVLVAEDMEINAEILLDLLEMEGVSADHAENGKIAVEMFSEKPEGTYDAILMDVRMPEMDGLTAAGIIRGLDKADAKTIPIVALTANAFDEDVQRSLQAGMNAHLSKPVEPEKLYETLGELIRRK